MLVDVNGELTEPQRRLLEAFTHLKDVDLRAKWEHSNGIYIAESHNVIERAINSGHKPAAFFLDAKWLPKLAPLLTRVTGARNGAEIPVFICNQEQSSAITGYKVHRGAIAAIERPRNAPLAELLAPLDPASTVAVLEGLVDHTNVGAIFRSAAAIGVDAIVVSPDCSDPLYRRSVRVSMGAVFQVPWTRLTDWSQINQLFDAGYELCALTPGATTSIVDYMRDRPDKIALMVGSEGPGLSEQALSSTATHLSIPMMHGVDSLNVATCAAISFWEALRH